MRNGRWVRQAIIAGCGWSIANLPTDRERLKRLLHAILKMGVKVQIKLPVVRFTEAVGVG